MKDVVKERLAALNETDLRKNVVIPLLERTPGVKQVTDVHGANEHGLDVIFFTADHIRTTCYGMQLKRGDISGGGSRDDTVKQIIDQLELATQLKHPVAVQPSGEYVIERCVVAANGRISSTARTEIAGRLKPTPVDFWDLSDIIRRANEVLPEVLQTADAEVVQYLKWVEAKCETLDSLDQVTGVAKRKLSDVFVEPWLRRRLDPTLADSKGPQQQVHSHDIEATALADQGHDSVLIGEQNEGKTAILRVIAIERVRNLLSGKARVSDGAQIPVLVRASDVLASESLRLVVANALSRGGANSLAEEVGRDDTLASYLVLIDGFSEITSEQMKQACANAIEDAQAETAARIVVSARPDDFLRPGFFDRFHHYTIRQFGQKEVRSLISKWTHDSVEFADVAEKMVDRVSDALQLPGSPIPAIIGVMLYEKEHKFITNTAEAVDRYMVIRLGRYAQEMNIRTEVEWQRKQDLLAEVAFCMVKEGLDEIPAGRAESIMMGAYDRLGEPSQARAAINELVTAGVLERRSDTLSFFRLGFRDFFAGKYIVSQHQTLGEFFKERLFDRAWGQALVFAAGLRRYNSDLLTELNNVVHSVRDQLSVADNEDYLYGAYLLGRILSNSDAAERMPRLAVLKTALHAARESADILAKEAQDQFGNIGQVVALVGTEHTMLVTVGVPWLAEQYLELITDPELPDEERYLLVSVYSHLACEDWMEVLEGAVKESRSPRVIAALLMLNHLLNTQREFTGAEKAKWQDIQKALRRQRERLGKSVDAMFEVKGPLLELERKRIRRLRAQNEKS